MSTQKRIKLLFPLVLLTLVLAVIFGRNWPGYSTENNRSSTQEDPEEFLVNDDFSAADQGYSDIGVDGIGNFWIVWQDNREGDYSTYAQHFAWDGERLGPNTPVNDDTDGDEQNDPHVGVSVAGYTKIVWQDFRVTGYPDNPDIYGQDINADGTANGANHRINADFGQAKQRKPNLDVSPAGAAIVVWEDYRLNNWDVYAQWYAAGGATAGGNVKVNDDVTNAVQHRPFVAADGSGNVLICWYDDRNGDDEVLGQIYNSSRGKVGVNFIINDVGAASKQKFPVAAGLPGGGFVVAWIDYRNGPYPDNPDVYAQIISPTGSKVGGNFRANDDGARVEQSEVQVGSAPTGGFVICWRDERGGDADIYAQRYDPSGIAAGGNFMVNAPDAAVLQSTPAVAMSDAKMYFTWTDNRNGGLFDIYGSIITYDNPTISPIPSFLYFEAEDGGPNPAAQQLMVTNSGAGVLEWAAVDDADWLSLSQNFGTAPTAVNVLVNISGLAIGDYSATITFTDLNDAEITGMATVELNVDYGAPLIEVNPLTLDFEGGVVGTPPLPQQIHITNIGGKTLNWQHSTSADWISLEPTTGTAPSTALVSVDPQGLTIGIHEGTLSFLDPTSYNLHVDMAITFEVIDNAPEIALSVSTLEFTAYEQQGNPRPRSVEITNIGYGDLDFTVGTGSTGLLNASPLSGTAPKLIDVFVFSDTLAPGDYRDTLVFSDPLAKNSPAKLPVHLEVWEVPPEIQLSKSEFVFAGLRSGAQPAATDFQIANTGGGLLHWSLDYSSGWLSCDPDTGSGAKTVDCQIDITSLASGKFADTIRVSDPAATNSPQAIPVRLTLDEPDTLTIPSVEAVPGEKVVLPLNLTNKDSVTDISLPIGYNPAYLVLDSAVFTGSRINNWIFKSVFTDPTAGTVKFFATSHAVPVPDNPLSPGTGAVGFLHFTVKGSTPGGTIMDLDTVALDLSPLSLGNTRGVAFVPRVQPGSIAVGVPAEISVAPGALTFAALRGGAAPATKEFAVTNTGGGTLAWTAAEDALWLSLAPDHGGNTQNVVCTINQSGLTAGTYTANVAITDPQATNSPQMVNVQLTLAEADTLILPVVDGLPGQSLVLPVTFGNIESVKHLLVPLKLNPAYVQLDSVSFVGTRLAGWPTRSSTVDGQNGTVVFSGSTTSAMPPGTGTIAIVHAKLAVNAPGGLTSTIDTATVSANTLSFVSADDAVFQPGVVPGRIQAALSPQISLSPTQLGFAAVRNGTAPAGKQFVVANTGEGTMAWTAVTSAGWISVVPGTGGNNQSVTATIATSTLASGVFGGNITVSDPNAGNSPQTVSITLAVDEPDTVVLPIVNADGGTNFVIPVNLTNYDGIKTLTIPIKVNPTYVRLDSVSFAGGRIAGWSVKSGLVNATAGTSVISGSSAATPLVAGKGTIGFIHGYLAPGAPGGQITTIDTATAGGAGLSATNSNNITFIPRVSPGRVQAAYPPGIALNPARLDFTAARGGVAPVARQFTVGNSGGGTFTWSAAASANWFALAPPTGAANQGVTCVVDNAGLSSGTYYGSAIITAPLAVNSPQHVTIVLSVVEPDTLHMPDLDAEPEQEVIVPVLLSNSDWLKQLTVPLSFDPEYVFLDSASFVGSRIAGWSTKSATVNNQNGTAIFSGSSSSAPLPPGSGIIGHVFLHVYPELTGLIIMEMDTISVGQAGLTVIDTAGAAIVPKVVPGRLQIAGLTGILDDPQPQDYTLPAMVNYPNPFNSETVIFFRGNVDYTSNLVVYDVLGRVVRDLSDEIEIADGSGRVMWDGSNDNGRPLGSGMYFATLRTAHRQVTRKILLLR